MTPQFLKSNSNWERKVDDGDIGHQEITQKTDGGQLIKKFGTVYFLAMIKSPM